jgi:hypothetical protein
MAAAPECCIAGADGQRGRVGRLGWWRSNSVAWPYGSGQTDSLVAAAVSRFDDRVRGVRLRLTCFSCRCRAIGSRIGGRPKPLL